MARGKAKTRSSEKSSAKEKSRGGKATPTKTITGSERNDGGLRESVLTLVSDKLGIPASQVSHMVEIIGQVAEEASDTDRIIEKHEADRGALIQILLEIQRENHWLPRDVLMSVCKKLGVPISRAYRIATFYKAFSLTPKGRHQVSVCTGTACHVRGAPRLLDRVTSALHINPGETSPDQKFTLETVNCLGCCALGPVIVVDGDYHGNPAPKEVERIINSYN